MRGIRKRKGSSGSLNEMERALFRELGAKSARSRASGSDARSVAQRPAGARGGRLRRLLVTVFAVARASADNPSGSGYEIGDGVIGDVDTTFFLDPVGVRRRAGARERERHEARRDQHGCYPHARVHKCEHGVDLSGMWLDTNVDPNTGHVWLYFAFSREGATTGQIGSEFQRNALPAACDFTNFPPSRTGALTRRRRR